MLLDAHPHLNLILVGDKNIIENHMKDLSRIKIIDTKQFISNDEDIVKSFYDKPNASIYLAIKELSESNSAIGLISPGNTGAMLIGALKWLRISPDIRPCLAAIIPNIDGSQTCLVDVGATIDCDAHQLHQFAKLGSLYMSNLYKIKRPKIGLISIGEEATKGNKVTKDAYQLLKDDKTLNFIGNVEGNMAFSGICDVLVGDGFTANQILKVTEGTAQRIINDIVSLRKDDHELIKTLKERYDLPNIGGGILLGTSKPVYKCRGNSNKLAIFNIGTLLIKRGL